MRKIRWFSSDSSVPRFSPFPSIPLRRDCGPRLELEIEREINAAARFFLERRGVLAFSLALVLTDHPCASLFLLFRVSLPPSLCLLHRLFYRSSDV